MFVYFRPKEERFNLGVSAMTSALQRAVNKKRFVREEKTQLMDKLERKSTQEQEVKDKDSRSESQASQAPSHLPNVSAAGKKK